MRKRGAIISQLVFSTLLFCLLSLPADADDPFELGILEAVNYGLENHVDHKIALINYENARIDNMIEEISGLGTPYELKKLEQKERQAEYNYQNTRSNVILNIVADYLDIKQIQRQVHILEKRWEIAARNLEITKQKVAIGEESQQDLTRMENNYKVAELNLKSAELNLNTRLKLFLHKLGINIEGPILLPDEPIAISIKMSIEEAINTGVANSFSLWASKTNMEIAKLDLENLRIQDVAAITLQKAENEYRIAELKAAESELSYTNNLISSYYNLADLEARLEIAVSTFALALEEANMAKKQYEAGLRSSLEWLRAQETILSAEKDYHDTLYKFTNARLSYLLDLGVPISLEEVFISDTSN